MTKYRKITILRVFFPELSMNHHQLLEKNILLKIFCTLLSFISMPVDFKELFARARNLGEAGISKSMVKK